MSGGNGMREGHHMNSGDLMGSAQDEEEDFMGDLEKPHQIESVKTSGGGGGQLLDLSRMLEVKKKQQQEKRKRVEQLNERHKSLVTYNPLMTKDAIDDKAKDIQNYKNKISQEKYFQSPNNAKQNTTQYKSGG